MEEFEIKKILQIVANKKFYIITIILLSLLIGGFYSFYMITPKYKSSTSILLVKTDENDSTAQTAVTQTDITLNQKLVSTYSQIIKSKKVLKSVIDNLQLNIKEDTLGSYITVSAVTNTELIKVSVINENPELAANIANEITNVFSKEVKDIYNINNVNVIDKAEPSLTPDNINHIKDLAISLFIGCVLSGILILAIYFLDTTIKGEDDVENFIGLSVLANIPFYAKSIQKQNGKVDRVQNKYKELVVYEDATSPISEFYRTLRANILFTKPDTKIKTILITSSMQSEGKTWVSSNLAVAYAQSNKRILIIDADMRKGRLHHVFNVVNRKGLSNCLSEMTENENMNIQHVSEYIQETDIPNLHIISGGNRPPNPAELVSSQKMKELLEIVKSMYDIIILDGTPSLMVSDSIVLSNIVDTTVIVTESRKSKIDNTSKLKKSIENAGGNIAGIVINKVAISAKAYKDRYYYSDKNKEEQADVEEQKENKSVKELVELATLPNEEIVVKKEEKQNIKEKENLSNTYIKNYYESDNKTLEMKFEIATKDMEIMKKTLDEMNKEWKNQKDDEEKEIIQHINNMQNDIQEFKVLNTEMMTNFQQYHLQQKQELNEKLTEIQQSNIQDVEKTSKLYEEILNKQEENEKNMSDLKEEVRQLKEDKNSIQYDEFKENMIQELNSQFDNFMKECKEGIEVLKQPNESFNYEEIEAIMNKKLEILEKEYEKMNQNILEEHNKLEKLCIKIEEQKKNEKDYIEQLNNQIVEKIKLELLEKFNKETQNKQLTLPEEKIVRTMIVPEKTREHTDKKDYRGWFGKKEKDIYLKEEIQLEDLEKTASYICQILNVEKAS